jgi:mono/diheme cytochrome c family protein
VLGFFLKIGALVFLSATAAVAEEGPSALIERGRYLAVAANCAACHTRPGGAPFAGGVPFVTKVGTLYSTNITPDPDIGIGRWTAKDLRRAMHEGVAPSGRRLFPAFPYPSFTLVSDEDVDAIYAYLRSLEPQPYQPPPNSFLLRQRWAMPIWNSLFFEPRRFAKDPAKSEEWNRGAYLVQGPGHCGACHTPRNALLAERRAEAFAGGTLQSDLGGGVFRKWSAVDLSPSKQGLAAWSVDDLTRYLRFGFSAKAGTFGPMNEVIVNSLKELSPEDVHAMAVYLKDLPPSPPASGLMPSGDEIAAGQPIYKKRCESCHGGSGRGGLFSGPPLAGSAIVQSDDPASLINVILYGADVPPGVQTGSWETMKPFREVLDDAEIASLANFLRGSWSNRARPVRASEIAQQRG